MTLSGRLSPPASVTTVLSASPKATTSKAPTGLVPSETYLIRAFVAEGGGFEPPEMRSTSTAFEAAPFVRSGNLPSTSLASWPPHADELDDPELHDQ